MFTTTVGRATRAKTGAARKGIRVMSAAHEPAQPGNRSPQIKTGNFEALVDGALRDHVAGTSAPPTLADLEPRQLLRYAVGQASDDERTALEDYVTRSRWAYDRVVALVRGNRPNAPDGIASTLSKRLLAAGKIRTETIVGQAILEVEGIKSKSLEDAWKSLEKNGSPKTRAACLIGLGRHEEARKILESQEARAAEGGPMSKSKDPAFDLLRRVSSAAGSKKDDEADEEALLALLDVLPSL